MIIKMSLQSLRVTMHLSKTVYFYILLMLLMFTLKGITLID